MKDDLKSLIAAFSRVESHSEFGPIPLERVLTQNWRKIAGCREEGWTWKQIAAALTRAGLRQKGDKPISEKYLSAVAVRMASKVAKQSAPLPRPIQPQLPPLPIITRTTGPHEVLAAPSTGSGTSFASSTIGELKKSDTLQRIRLRMRRAQSIRDE